MDPKTLRQIARHSPHLANQISNHMNMGRIPTGPALPAPNGMPVATHLATPSMSPAQLEELERQNQLRLQAQAQAQAAGSSPYRPLPTKTPAPDTSYIAPELSYYTPGYTHDSYPTAPSKTALDARMAAYGAPSVDTPPSLTPQAQVRSQQRAVQDLEDDFRRRQMQMGAANRQASADIAREADRYNYDQRRALHDSRDQAALARQDAYQASRANPAPGQTYPTYSYTPTIGPSKMGGIGSMYNPAMMGGPMGMPNSAPTWGQLPMASPTPSPMAAPTYNPYQLDQQMAGMGQPAAPMQAPSQPYQPTMSEPSKGSGMTRGIGSLPFGSNMPDYGPR